LRFADGAGAYDGVGGGVATGSPDSTGCSRRAALTGRVSSLLMDAAWPRALSGGGATAVCGLCVAQATSASMAATKSRLTLRHASSVIVRRQYGEQDMSARVRPRSVSR
jgi:hypothetical protein